MDASEYKNVVLGLIFLKYIYDRFEAKYQELVEEGDGFEEDIDEYTSEGIFFVPVGARWSEIASKAHTPEIGVVIDDAMRAIEKENKRLKDILPKNFARPELDKRRLGDVVDLFTNVQMIEHGDEKDILGRTYEYCLSICLLNRKVNVVENSLLPPVWFVLWLKCYSLSRAACTTLAAEVVACSCNPQNSLKAIAATSTISPYTVRTPILQRGKWHR